MVLPWAQGWASPVFIGDQGIECLLIQFAGDIKLDGNVDLLEAGGGSAQSSEQAKHLPKLYLKGTMKT